MIKLTCSWNRMGLPTRFTVVMGIMCSFVLALSACIMIAEIPFVEEKLFSESLYYELHASMSYEKQDPRSFSLANPEHMLYSDDEEALKAGAQAIPERYLNLPDGYSEYEGTRSYFVYKEVKDNHIYIIESDQTEFEETESELRYAVIGGCLIMLVMLIVCFRWMINKLLQPVRDIAHEVKKSAECGYYRPLNVELSHDDIGYLAGTCDRALKHVYELLASERFFSADLSHELRTRLSVISTSAELMLETTQDQHMRRALENMLKACDDTLRLLRVLLSLARHDHRQSADQDLLTLEDVAVKVCTSHKEAALKKGISITIKKDAKICTKRFNESLLITLMDNLVRNAVAYTDHGSVELRLKADRFEVQDSGRGIKQEDLQAIFDPFYRSTSSHGVHGSGVGLSLSYRICKAMGWKLEVSSKEDQGSTFSVILS